MASSSVFRLLALLVAAGAVPAQAGFEAILWRHRGPALAPEFARSIGRAGLTGVCVDQDEDPRRAHGLGLRFYLDHAAGKGTLHLREKPFLARLKAYERSRRAADAVRPNPLGAATVRSRLLALVEKRVGRAAPLQPLMVSLDDEISTTRFVNPIDFCFAPSTLAGFRRWLTARYGTIDALNRAWGSEFAGFPDVVPPTTDEMRERERGRPWPRNLTAWNAHREYMEILLQQTIGLLARRSRSIAPGVPVGFEGGQPPSAFGGFDWARLLAVADFVEPYDIGGTRELVRSLKRPGTAHFETIFPEKDPLLASRSVGKLYDAAAHGLTGVIIWSAGEMFASADRLRAYGRLLAPELVRLTGERGRSLRDAEPYAGEVAILESQPSVRLHWVLDAAGDGGTWTRRFSSHERGHSTSQAARLSWVRLLQDLGYAFRFVTPEQLTKARFGGGRAPRVLILPGSLALADRSLREIARFAERGGLVLADETPGRYTERLALRKRPAFDLLFGVERAGGKRWLREGRVLAGAPRTRTGLGIAESGLAPEGVTVARRVSDGFVLTKGPSGAVERPALRSTREDWCQFERTVGRGRAVLLNLAVAEYAAGRLVEGKVRMCRDLRNRVRRLLDKHGVRETALCRVAGYPTILERSILTKGDEKILVVRANCLENPALFQRLVAKGPQPMTVVLPMAVRLKDLWTGKPVGRGGRRIEVTLDPLRGSFFLIEAL